MNRDFLIRHATLRQLQILTSVAYMQSYTKAANNLYLSQPTVSIQIQKLSDAIGMPLFDCVGKKLHLTVAGNKVLQAAEEILDCLAHLSDDIIELQGEVKGELKISSVTNAKYFMPKILGVFLQNYPDVKPALKVTNRSSVLSRLKNNEDDIYITGQITDNQDVIIHPFIENEMVIVAYPNHPLKNKKNISLTELCKHQFIRREHGSGTRIAFDKLIEDHQLDIISYMELGSSEAIKQAVMAELGIAVLSLNNIQLELSNNLLIVLSVDKFPIKRYWNVVYSKNKHLSLVAKTFYEFMLKEGIKISS